MDWNKDSPYSGDDPYLGENPGGCSFHLRLPELQADADGNACPKTEKEPPLIPGNYAPPEAAAHIMVQKFVMYAPLYQQEQEWCRTGVMISRRKMSNWVLRVVKYWLRPIYDQLHWQLLHTDGSTGAGKPDSQEQKWDSFSII